MGIVRTRTVLVRSGGPQTHHAVLTALAAASLEIRDSANPIRARSPFSLRKNRWAADLTIEILEDRMVWTIDALGDKHEKILAELLERLPVGMVDDQGVGDVVARLPRSSKIFGKAEVRNLATILTPTERVVAIAIGTFETTMGALVLTTERVVFFDQEWKSQHVEEFALDAINSLSVTKKLTGESVSIALPGRQAEISALNHGAGEEFVAAFRRMRDHRAASAVPALPYSPASSPVDPPVESDAFDQLRKLGELHQAGILTDEEFASAKADILRRL